MSVVAIMGTSNGGCAAAAHLGWEGHEVRLWGRPEGSWRELLARSGRGPGEGRLELTGILGEGEVAISLVSDDVESVLAAAEVVLVPLPADTHVEVARRMARHLTEDQVVVFLPGNLASARIGPHLREAGTAPLALAETATLPYGARRLGGRRVAIAARPNVNPVAFAAGGEPGAFDVLSGLFPELSLREHLLDVALLNPNAVIHPASVVLNVGPLETSESFDIHAEGITPTVRQVMRTLDAERIAVRRAVGFAPPDHPIDEFYDPEPPPTAMWGTAQAEIGRTPLWREAHRIDSRYLHEDVAYGLNLLIAVGEAVGVATPVARAIRVLASTSIGFDLDRRGAAVELGPIDTALMAAVS